MSKRPFLSVVVFAAVAILSPAANGENEKAPTAGQAVAAGSPADLILQADKKREAGDYDGATQLLNSAAAHPQATDEDKTFIAARTAEVARARDAKVTAARQTLDEVSAELGKPDANLNTAETRLKSVKSASLNLGFFDNSRLDRMLAVVAERRGTSPVSAVTLAQAEPAKPADPVKAADPAKPVDTAAPAAAPAAPAAAPAPAAAEPAKNDPLALARKLVIEEKLLEARNAEANGQFNIAAKLYGEVVAIDPSNAAAKAARDAAAARALPGAGGPVNVIGKIGDIQKVEREATITEYNELMNKAEKFRVERNYPNAEDAVQQAKVVIDRNKSYLGNTEYVDLRDKANKKYADITLEKEKARTEGMKVSEDQDKKDAENRRIRAKLEQYEQVQRLLQRAADLRKTQDYDRSLQLIHQALFLDPGNPAAEAMKVMIEDSQIAVKAKEYMRIRALRVARQSVDLIEATIPYNELITYPSDWPQLTATRLGALSKDANESEINRRVSLKLQDPVPVNFDANKFVNVVDYFRNTTGVNFFVNWAALEAAGIEQDLPINLQLNNVPAEQALKLVLQQAGAAANLEKVNFSIIDGVVHISTQRDLQKTTDTRVYDIRDLLVQVPNFSGAPEFDLNQALSNTSSGGSSGGAASASTTLFGTEEETQKQPTREELIEQITTLIQDTIGVQADWAAYGGEVSSLRELNGNLIVKSTPDNHRDIVKLLGQLRAARAMQIHIEARFLLVETNFLDEVGVDLDFQYRSSEGRFLGPITVAQDHIGMAGASDTGFPGNFGNASTGTDPFTPGLGFPPVGTGAGQPGTPPNRSLRFGIGVTFFDDLDVNLIVNATQASRRSIALTAPRLTLFNGQRSHVMVARQIAFISDLEPVSDAGFDPTLSVTQSGVVLDVEATVSADRRYVTMTARPSLATVVQPIRSIPQQGAGVLDQGNGGGDNAGENVLISGFIEAPELELTQVRTSVSVPDKGTLLMGGQRVVADVEVEAGVPILSKIPVLNRFFTNTSKVKDERTLLILIKPTIILQDEQEDLLFPGLLQDPAAYNAARNLSPLKAVGDISAP